MMTLKEKIEKLIIEAIKELNENLGKKELNSPSKETKLYGGNAVLDSLSLVGLIVDIEERLLDELDISVVLASERAMSRRSSPFRTVKALTDYIEELVNEG